MTVRIDAEIVFADSVYFSEPPSYHIYKQLLRFIRTLTCFAKAKKCAECEECSLCRYYRITGENFSGYPAFLPDLNLFERRRVLKEQPLKVSFWFIGDTADYRDFADLFFSDLDMMLNTPCRCIRCEWISEDEIIAEIQNVSLLTLIEKDNLAESYNAMVSYYNSHYKTRYPLVNSYLLESSQPVQMNLYPFYLGTRKISPAGVLNSYVYPFPIEIPALFFRTGIGKYNFLGGGRFALKTDTES